MKLKLTFIEELLATKAADPEVFATYIASKAPDDDKRQEEIATAEQREESGSTIFHRQNGSIGVWDYQIKGFFKDACGSLRNADGTKSKELKAYKTKIDGLVFVTPRFIPLTLPSDTKIGICERPLRADTAMGPRVALARSETSPPGTSLVIEIRCLAKTMEPLVLEWLAYGELRGLGQWRNSGKGRFTTEVLPE